MELALLADFPEYAPRVAHWYFDEWVSQVPGRTVEDVLTKVSASASRSGLPVMVIAKEGCNVIGAAELKEREMDIYPEFTYWLGGVYVDSDFRGRGTGVALVCEVIRRAKRHGVGTLYLQTEDLSGGMYNRLGFKTVEKATYKGRVVLVMAADLNA